MHYEKTQLCFTCKELHREHDKRWRQKLTPEQRIKSKESVKAYYHANRDRLVAGKKEYYKKVRKSEIERNEFEVHREIPIPDTKIYDRLVRLLFEVIHE